MSHPIPVTFPQRIAYEQALDILRAEARLREPRLERVALAQAAGRVLSEDLQAVLDLPGFDNSAMDGFSLRHAALAAGQRRFIEIGQQWAGDKQEFPLTEDASLDYCVRITTGAPLPSGFDTVVIEEHCEFESGSIRLQDAAMNTPMGANIRRRGEDMRAGQSLLRAGSSLTPLQVSLAASQGFAHLPCNAKPTVAILTTGDEIVPPGQALSPGQIHDSNRSLLQGLLRELGIEAVAWPAVRDDPDALRAALTDLTESFDLVLSCGGVSAGERDHLPALLQEHGAIRFWKVRIKPGMPVLFGTWNRALLMGLPGNPVSVLATFHTLVVPLLQALQRLDGGLAWRPAALRSAIGKTHPRMEFLRGSLQVDEQGRRWVDADPVTSSHRLAAAADNDVLIRLEEGECEHAEGEALPVLEIGGRVGQGSR